MGLFEYLFGMDHIRKGVFSDTLTLEGDVISETIATSVLFGYGYNNTAIGKDYLHGVIGSGNDRSSLLG